MSDRGKVTEQHRRRRAVVYVRQSTLHQIERNVESSARQRTPSASRHMLGSSRSSSSTSNPRRRRPSRYWSTTQVWPPCRGFCATEAATTAVRALIGPDGGRRSDTSRPSTAAAPAVEVLCEPAVVVEPPERGLREDDVRDAAPLQLVRRQPTSRIWGSDRAVSPNGRNRDRIRTRNGPAGPPECRRADRNPPTQKFAP